MFGPLLRKDPTFGGLTSLYAIDADGSDLVLVLDCEVACPHVSPDGTQLVFGIHMDNGSMQVATMAVDGTNLRILTSDGYNEYPDWSPDGSWLVYSRVRDADLAAINRECPVSDCLVTLGLEEPLWRMGADGSNPRQIGNPDTVDFWPRLSPDGQEVAFIRVDPPNKDWFTVMIRDLATGEEHQATANDREPVLPEWSRDGRSILYTTNHRPGSTDVWTRSRRYRRTTRPQSPWCCARATIRRAAPRQATRRMGPRSSWIVAGGCARWMRMARTPG